MIDAINRKSFAADMAAGMKIAKLAEKYNVSWPTAIRIADQINAEDAEPEQGLPDAVKDAEPTEEAPDAFDITVQIPSHRLMDLIRGIESGELLSAIEQLDAQAQADLFQAILRRRFEQMLEPKHLDTTPLQLYVDNQPPLSVVGGAR